MNISYEKDLDYMEILFAREANYGDLLSDKVMVFKSEKTDKIIGYAFENASQTIFEVDFLHIPTKLAAQLRMLRSTLGITQVDAAKRIGDITLRHYRSR